MKNTAEVCLAAGGTKPPKSTSGLLKPYKKRRTFVPLDKIN